VGIYVPDGNLLERLGHVVAKVLSAGKGYYQRVGKREVFVPNEVSPGDRVVFRGHLKNANMVGHEGYCFLHARDLIGILEDETVLDLALPYDN
jgi:co-chaperonin GroES (HSP10)